MTASYRPDMTLEEIIDRVTNARDHAATLADLLPLMATRLQAEPVGTRAWYKALTSLNRTSDLHSKISFAASCWEGQRDASARLLGHQVGSHR